MRSEGFLRGLRLFFRKTISFKIEKMAFPIKVCVICSEEFELRPDKPGFANRCPACSEPESDGSDSAPSSSLHLSAEERRAEAEANEARRKAIRDLLYRQGS
jgi:hypothetical protein